MQVVISAYETTAARTSTHVFAHSTQHAARRNLAAVIHLVTLHELLLRKRPAKAKRPACKKKSDLRARERVHRSACVCGRARMRVGECACTHSSTLCLTKMAPSRPPVVEKAACVCIHMHGRVHALSGRWRGLGRRRLRTPARAALRLVLDGRDGALGHPINRVACAAKHKKKHQRSLTHACTCTQAHMHTHAVRTRIN